MIILVIHAPKYRERDGAKSFEAVLADGKGEEYAIFRKHAGKLHPGCTVVLIRKDENRRRAEGILVKLEQTTKKTRNGIWRYNVYIKNLKGVTYKEEKLNRYGVAVIGDC